MAPNYELLKVHGIAFSDDLDAAVRAVAHPATQTELAGAVASGRAEKHSLHPAMHDQVNPFHSLTLVHEIF